MRDNTRMAPVFELRDVVINLAERIARDPEERDLLCEALKVKIAEMRKRGETVPEDVRRLEETLELCGDDDDNDLWDNIPV